MRGDAVIAWLLLCIAPAIGGEEEAPAGEPVGDEPVGEEPAEEIIIYSDLEEARAKARVVRDLKDLGYREGRRGDGYTVFRPDVAWRPTVRLYDDGFTIIKRSPVRFAAPGDPDNKLNYLWCVPPFTIMCVRVGGQMVSGRKLEHQKAEVAYVLEPDMRTWRDALQARALAEKLDGALPDQLEALWSEGQPVDPREPKLPDPNDRRAAILDLWTSRTCTDAGQAVRDAVEIFLSVEVQPSPWPVTAAEQAAAEAAQACGDQLDLD